MATAREIIENAKTLTEKSSMFELVEAANDLRMLDNIVAGGTLNDAHMDASMHVAILTVEQKEKAAVGELVRIF
jgi:hypothetical protein